ncbi:paraquat-inducible protein A [Paracoccus yeei]|jgi:paraquat-inducible protein A|uniref:Paraquat-inducible protein A n=1 Tax=Paracoccus yeei TaxID=147645 RepID=A0A1V0GSC7_9RHOB|nr:paraquat-inducible protein A [Paracoccus yeei]ARC36731.1 paraquat-inducible protein A [Paracoccus yeei]ATQ55213.1 paraquat-inducible protein A [Paracoccus yeei]AYF02517.1 paraquat-inducible protein A [Paracoccus yeei]OWJ92264.1 paraquat-inducible protein A [Paracoccus yeei]QEU07217.1 paraquat-inducible protein A [Paracoccus yeei]
MNGPHDDAPVLTAHRAGLVGCRACGRVWPEAQAVCTRCGSDLSPPDRRSLNAVWAWLAAGLIFYVPANLFPMLRTSTFGGLAGNSESTIFGGVIELIHYGNWGVAAVVFLASIVVPIGKFLAIGWLATVAGRPATVNDAHRRLRVYELVEFIGRWSMIDVFIVAILSALVQLGFVASIHPGPAAVSFALSVAFTMLSAQSFDPRLIWRGLPLRRRKE